jgi:scyllo-inositol 2-dehydrogenase (NADP+)
MRLADPPCSTLCAARQGRPLYAVVMREPIRAGVVGFGLAGRVFHTAVIQATPGLGLGCVVQRSGDEAAREYPGVKIARSVEEMLGDVGIQLVVIATPSYSHFELARQCLREQRHVVVDKPFTLTSGETAELIHLAHERKLVLAPYQNRRWDGDFQTVREVIASGDLGRLVTYESHFDRFRAEPRRNVWRESGGAGSGILYDLGPHLIDQALALFGVPAQITADVRIDRENGAADDAFDLRLEYTNPHRLTILLRATLTACAPGPRFLLHGTQGSFVKWGLDPQEEQIKGGMAVGAPEFGREDESRWGELTLASGEKRRIQTRRGDYRGFYANVRDTLLGKAHLDVRPEDAWRTARMIELARESSGQGRRLEVDFSAEP